MTIINGRYELHERLGEGGMATVYRATQRNLDREVAIKFIKTDVTGKEFVVRFEREAKAIAQLNHPNITQVYDFDYDDDGNPFMVMELLHGKDLAAFLEDTESLTVGDAVTIMQSIALALGYAHAHGIIHRDVKPSNIFVTDDHQIKLMDFGLVKQLDDAVDLTSSGILVGTPRYISPEQASSKPSDHRADLYALGIVFYELLTGEQPFSGTNALDIALQHITKPAPDPRDVRPDMPEIASMISDRLLAKDPDDRYQDAAALLRDLEAFEEDILRETGVLPRVDVNQAVLKAAVTPVLGRTAAPPMATTRTDLDDPLPDKTNTTSLTQTLMQQRVSLPMPLIVLALLVTVVIGVAVLQLTRDNGGGLPTLTIAPAGTDEYLVLVGQWGPQSDTLERRIVDAISSSDAVGMSIHAELRIEPIDYPVSNAEDAQTLAESVGAHLVVWGVEDEIGVEVVFQDIFAEPDSARAVRFIIPANDDYATILAEDMPVAVRFYLSSMLLHHFVRTGDIDGLTNFGFTAAEGAVDELRVIAPNDLDRHILSMFIWEEGEDNVAHTIEAATAAIRLAPGDPSLYFLRGFFEGFYRGNMNRARADVDNMRDLLGENNLTLWAALSVELSEQNYPAMLDLSDGLDPDSLGYGVPFSYRQTALVMTGDYTTVQAETQGSITEETVFGLPIWDTMNALTYEIAGDEAGYEAAAERVGNNRNLEDSAGFITSISTPPIDFYLTGGYIAELSGTPLQALLAYQAGLRQSPDHYLMNWRLGVLNATNGNAALAYDFLQAARDNAPGPFPIAAFQQARLVDAYAEDVPEDAPSACALLAQALNDTSTDPDFYTTLITQIEDRAGQWDCELDAA